LRPPPSMTPAPRSAVTRSAPSKQSPDLALRGNRTQTSSTFAAGHNNAAATNHQENARHYYYYQQQHKTRSLSAARVLGTSPLSLCVRWHQLTIDAGGVGMTGEAYGGARDP
jgi:hypothetical protein